MTSSDNGQSEANVVFAYVLAGRQPWGTRLLDDGAVEELASPSATSGDAETGDVAAASSEDSGAWRPRARLSPDQFESALDAIRSSGVLELPAEVGDRAAVRDGSAIHLSVVVDNGRHDVTAHGTAGRSGPIELLRQRFERLVGEALTRDRASD